MRHSRDASRAVEDTLGWSSKAVLVRETRAVRPAPLELPEVARVTYLRLELVGPRTVYVIGDVDLVGDAAEAHVAVRLRALEARISASAAGAGAV